MGASALKTYRDNVDQVRLLGFKSHLSETEVNLVMDQCMESLIVKQNESKYGKKGSWCALCPWIEWLFSILWKFFVLFVVFLVTVLVIYIVLQHKPIQYFIQSKLQDFIYPGMKILRKLFLPIISVYPSLTNFYDESCLITNPFFRVPDMPCPCEDVRAILNLTGDNVKRDQYHSGIPIVVKMAGEEVSWDRLKSLYYNYSSIFDRDAPYLHISSPIDQVARRTAASMFKMDWNSNDESWEYAHVQWRCNRMEPTRLLRSIFGVPVHEPNYATGVSIEKIVMIDGPNAPLYRMPTTDGTTVFVQQSSGSRMIVLTPASECKGKCTPVSIDLPSGHILWFSWWYWRASSLPNRSASSISITYVGSYM